MPSDSVLILGGGPAGMAAAMELSKAGRQSTIVEKASDVGGLAKTMIIERPEGTYRTDIGPHRFFSKNKYLYDFIQDLLGEEWIQVKRLTRFYVDGKYYFYPVRLGNVLKQMGPLKAVRVLFDFLYEKIRGWVLPRQINSFEDYAVANFGRGLAEFNMLNYTEKIWGIPCTQISRDWALQRIGGLSVTATLKKLLFKKGGPKSLVDTFFYPELGSGTIYRAIAERIRAKGSVILTESEPCKIRHAGGKVTEIEVKTASGIQTFAPDAVACSIPVTQAVRLFDPPAPKEVLDAAAALKFRAQVYLFLTVDRDSVSKDNWVYFPDKNIPFGRFSEMKNFSVKMSPAGKTSLFVEYFCFEGDSIWTMDKDALLALTMTHMEKLGFLNRTEVTSVHHYRQAHVYPIYDLHYKDHAETIMNWLDGFQNFFAIGRPGRFRYTNQDHSLEMGILAARSIIDEKRYDVETIGAEKEYFERGYVPAK
jgi:protoporphyrinogen oxidase